MSYVLTVRYIKVHKVDEAQEFCITIEVDENGVMGEPKWRDVTECGDATAKNAQDDPPRSPTAHANSQSNVQPSPVSSKSFESPSRPS